MENIKLDLKKLENKVRFIRCVVNDEIVVINRKRADLFLELRQKNFDPLPKKNKRATAALGAIVENEENEESHVAAKGDDPCYDYLLSMSIDTLNVEKMQKLIAERDKLIMKLRNWRKHHQNHFG